LVVRTVFENSRRQTAEQGRVSVREGLLQLDTLRKLGKISDEAKRLLWDNTRVRNEINNKKKQ